MPSSFWHKPKLERLGGPTGMSVPVHAPPLPLPPYALLPYITMRGEIQRDTMQANKVLISYITGNRLNTCGFPPLWEAPDRKECTWEDWLICGRCVKQHPRKIKRSQKIGFFSTGERTV